MIQRESFCRYNTCGGHATARYPLRVIRPIDIEYHAKRVTSMINCIPLCSSVLSIHLFTRVCSAFPPKFQRLRVTRVGKFQPKLKPALRGSNHQYHISD